MVSQAPVCKDAAVPTQEVGKEGHKLDSEEATREQALLLPFGVENPRKGGQNTTSGVRGKKK